MAAIPSTLNLDSRSLVSLQSRAAADPKAVSKEAAKQFESLFMSQLLKTMRESTQVSADGGMFDSAGTKMGTEMLDSQLAQNLSGQPGGLADVIARQLDRLMGMTPGPIPVTRSANNTPAPIEAKPTPTRVPQTGALGFVQQHTDAAEAAERKTGIPAAFMVSQAALETGWGRKEIRHADGSPSFNLFGIKAGASWKGATAEVTTTEYINGKAQKVVAKFRAYGSYEESFADYAKLMAESPRYAPVVAQASSASGFAHGLQKAGYATDPAYADKLSRVINTTLRLQRSLG